MKFGRTLMELAQELDRQRNAKHDYLLDTLNIIMDSTDDGQSITRQNPQQRADGKNQRYCGECGSQGNSGAVNHTGEYISA